MNEDDTSKLFFTGSQLKSVLLNVPMYHCFGCVLGALPGIIRGARLHFPAPTFNPVESLKGIETEKCNIWFGTPTMYVDMLARAQQTGVSLDFNSI